MKRIWSVVVVLVACGGCMNIPLQDTSRAASEMAAPVRVGMSPAQVHSALGRPDYAENAKTFLGVRTGQVQEVYEGSVSSKHFFFEPVVIACRNKNGVVDTRDYYKVLVRYDHALRVCGVDVVPSWAHGQDMNAPTVPIPQ